MASAPPTRMSSSSSIPARSGEVIFPNGKYIGDEPTPNLIDDPRQSCRWPTLRSRSSATSCIQRLQALVTAGVNVSDQEVRDTYRKDNIKIKFDYAVLSSTTCARPSIRLTPNSRLFSRRTPRVMQRRCPSSARSPISLSRPIRFPAAFRSPSQQRDPVLLQPAPVRVPVPEQSRSRHILIKVAPGRRRQD